MTSILWRDACPCMFMQRVIIRVSMRTWKLLQLARDDAFPFARQTHRAALLKDHYDPMSAPMASSPGRQMHAKTFRTNSTEGSAAKVISGISDSGATRTKRSPNSRRCARLSQWGRRGMSRLVIQQIRTDTLLPFSIHRAQ